MSWWTRLCWGTRVPGRLVAQNVPDTFEDEEKQEAFGGHGQFDMTCFSKSEMKNQDAQLNDFLNLNVGEIYCTIVISDARPSLGLLESCPVTARVLELADKLKAGLIFDLLEDSQFSNKDSIYHWRSVLRKNNENGGRSIPVVEICSRQLENAPHEIVRLIVDDVENGFDQTASILTCEANSKYLKLLASYNQDHGNLATQFQFLKFPIIWIRIRDQISNTKGVKHLLKVTMLHGATEKGNEWMKYSQFTKNQFKRINHMLVSECDRITNEITANEKSGSCPPQIYLPLVYVDQLQFLLSRDKIISTTVEVKYELLKHVFSSVYSFHHDFVTRFVEELVLNEQCSPDRFNEVFVDNFDGDINGKIRLPYAEIEDNFSLLYYAQPSRDELDDRKNQLKAKRTLLLFAISNDLSNVVDILWSIDEEPLLLAITLASAYTTVSKIPENYVYKTVLETCAQKFETRAIKLFETTYALSNAAFDPKQYSLQDTFGLIEYICHSNENFSDGKNLLSAYDVAMQQKCKKFLNNSIIKDNLSDRWGKFSLLPCVTGTTFHNNQTIGILTPKTKLYIDLSFNFLFFVLLYVWIWNLCSPATFIMPLVVVVWTILYLEGEFYEWKSRKSDYFDIWNFVDLISFVLIVISMAFFLEIRWHHVTYYERCDFYFNKLYGVQTGLIVAWFFFLIRLFRLGAMTPVPVLRYGYWVGKIIGESAGIFLIYFAICVVYGLGMQLILYPNNVNSLFIKGSFLSVGFQLIGEMVPGETTNSEFEDGNENCKAIKSGDDLSRRLKDGDYDMSICPMRDNRSSIIAFTFILLTQVVMLNFLIASMNTTYAASDDHSWTLKQFQLIDDYQAKYLWDITPFSVFNPFVRYYRKLKKCGQEKNLETGNIPSKTIKNQLKRIKKIIKNAKDRVLAEETSGQSETMQLQKISSMINAQRYDNADDVKTTPSSTLSDERVDKASIEPSPQFSVPKIDSINSVQIMKKLKNVELLLEDLKQTVLDLQRPSEILK